MRVLQLHCDKIEYTPTKKEISSAEDIEPTGHSAEVESVMREDLPDDSLKLEDVMANAPRREGDFIRIRPVLE